MSKELEELKRCFDVLNDATQWSPCWDVDKASVVREANDKARYIMSVLYDALNQKRNERVSIESKIKDALVSICGCDPEYTSVLVNDWDEGRPVEDVAKLISNHLNNKE